MRKDLREEPQVDILFVAAPWQVTAASRMCMRKPSQRRIKNGRILTPLPNTHSRPLPQTVSWGLRIKTVPEAIDLTWKNPWILEVTCQSRGSIPCGWNSCVSKQVPHSQTSSDCGQKGQIWWNFKGLPGSLLSCLSGETFPQRGTLRRRLGRFPKPFSSGAGCFSQWQPLPKGF